MLRARSAPVQGNGRPLISARRIAKRVRELGIEISNLYSDLDQPLVMIVILKGAAVFAADLLRSLSIPAELEFVRASSYGGGTASSGKVKFAHLVEGPLTGRDVLLVENIDFTGFKIPDRFVIGYGLDYAGLYRELPGIYSLG
jgi:hypoxanthine phosphoribosyltransferase